MGETPEAAARTTRRRYVWIGAAAVAVAALVGTTALFGGFAEVEPPAVELETIGAGDPHENDRYRIAFGEAFVADEVSESGIYPEDDERVLVVFVEVENVSGQPFSASDALERTIETPETMGEAWMRVTRVDDGTRSPWLQPDLPATLMLAWPVPAGALDDELTFTLHDPQRYELSRIATGTSWSQTIPGATVVLSVDDRGTGEP